MGLIGSAALRSWTSIGVAVGVAVLALGAYPAFALRDLPAPGNDLVSAGSILIYDRYGRLLAERDSRGEFHVAERLSQMGKWGPEATLAAEDRGFYHHGPLDATALVRAAFVDLAGGRVLAGGSSITQQLVKIQLLGPERSLRRKLQEAYLAWAVERRYSKDQILEMYLNRVYYGHGAYGLAAATKVYFGRDREPAQLDAGQAAFLAGLLSAPATNDPQTNWPGARARELYVLGGLVAMGDLSPAEADAAAREDIRSELRYDPSYLATKAPHFVDYVMRRLEADYGAQAVQRGGWSVYTTLDPDLQALGERAVRDGVRALAGRGINNGALLAVRPATGEILAWVGSADFSNAAIGGQYNLVLAPRQPGSSFKPYVYEAALKDRKIQLCTILHDVPTDFNGYQPVDFDNSYLGDLTARQALVLSRNIPAVEVAQLEGIDRVIALAHSMGIQTHLDPSLPTAIGASDVTMFDHVQGYQVFADQGLKVPLMATTRVVDPSGDVVYQQRPGTQPGQERVLTPAEAYLISDTLKAYQDQWGLGWNRRLAGKSGTTGGAETGVHRDAWMMAYNPDIVVAAWGGNTEANGPGRDISAFGTDVGSTMSASFINGLPARFSDWYQAPPGIKTGGPDIQLMRHRNPGPGPGAGPGRGSPARIQPDCTGAPSQPGGGEGD